ncbi:PfkB family carbohydrate kinase [Tropicimonas sp. IMCC34043]|uniref:PfkB family carbohydrate kinase n=1 Tax=Tropicimonas sp. IMCC34043 TaxID=2248760 RepID=UPI000E269114|nr:PfkB family carbohydrate kinase [Tropicimonas sp. IMCC34043]
MSALLQMTGPVIDLLYEVAALPRSGEEAVVTGFAMAPGGGFNAMVAARRAGMAAMCGGGVGTGPFSELVMAGFASEGIGLARPRDPVRDNGCCTVLIEPSGERSFVAAPNAEGHMTAADLAAISVRDFGWTLVSGYSLHYDGMNAAISGWIDRTAALPPLVFDPSPLVAELPADLLRPVLARATWISANASEARHLTGRTDLDEAVADLARGRDGAILRDGARGCWLATGGRVTQIPPFEVRAIDTNGAGDTHIGSFLARLDATGDALHAARYANVAAALSTTVKGPSTAPPEAGVLALLAQGTDTWPRMP